MIMLLTVDIGTSSLKAALWDYEGRRLDFAAFPLSITLSEGLKHEAECSQWITAFENACRKFRKPEAVEAIILCGNGPSLVPVTGEPSFGKGLSVPAENARLWLDRRALKYQAQVAEVMGGFVDASFFLPKMLAIKTDESELYKQTEYFLGCPEYLAYALTGNAHTIFPSEGFDRWFWNDEVLKKLDLDSAKIPAFIRPGDQFGALLPSVAKLLGFKKDIPVITGGPDFFAAIIGAGVTEPGQVLDRTGSSEGINLCTQNRVNDKRLMSYGHPVKPYWNLSGIISTAGKAVEWARDLLALDSFEDFYALANESEHGSGGLIFLPYLAGEREPICKPDARALWNGLSLSTCRREIAASVLEGIAFAIRDVISVMEETGEEAKQLRVTGGLAKIAILNQIKADVTGKEILEPVYKEAELLGLAIIGACCLGKYSSYKEAASKMVRIEKTYIPNFKNTALYNNLFIEYKRSQIKILRNI